MNKRLARMRRGAKLRAHLRKLGAKRLIVHRTLRHIYAQIISSDHSTVLASASTVEKDIKSQLTVTGNKHAAVVVGHVIAQRALNNGVCNVSFDRSGFKYHGRVRALAEAAREYGMKF